MQGGLLVFRAFAGALAVLVCISHVVETRQAPRAACGQPPSGWRSAGSGYIYSDEAYSHLTFQVIGSRLKPGCAEGKIVSTAVNLMRRAGGGLQ
jgi:hypothetical protein